VNGEDTGIHAGPSDPEIEIGGNGNWWINGEDTGIPAVRPGIRVYFDANGGSPATYYITIPAVPYTIALPGGDSFSRAGYVLAGWSRSAVHANAPVYETDFLAEGPTILFAKWVSESALYETVTFSSSWHTGGTVPSPIRAFHGYAVTIPYAAPTRTGFVFVGWHRNENSGTATYQPGDVITSSIATGANFYAVWRPYRWQTVTAGANHALGIAVDGSLWAWGGNANGRLGDGTTTTRFDPVPIMPGTKWVYVSAWNHSAAIRDDGTLWTWGLNQFGQLGNGAANTAVNNIPVQVGGDSWHSVAAGIRYTMGIRADGSLWAWGNNQFGQLGDGTTTSSFVPVRVGLDSDWRSVTANNNTTQETMISIFGKSGTLV